MKAPGPLILEKPDARQKQPEGLTLAEKQMGHLAFLQLVTFRPVGRIDAQVGQRQRREFLDSVYMAARPLLSIQMGSRLAGESSRQARRQSLSAASMASLQDERRKKEAASVLSQVPSRAEGGSSQAGGIWAGEGPQQKQREPEAGPPALHWQPLLSGQKSPAGPSGGQQASAPSKTEIARDSLAFVLADFARGDARKLDYAMRDFESRISSPQYRGADLMATMLLVIEDAAWEGEEGAAGSARHFGARARKPVVVPEIVRQSAMDSSIVRLASVREMLRYYFERHPREYAQALAAALGITADQEGDSQFLQERLAAELAHVGGFAFAQKLLAELKRRKKLDREIEKCMLELGYRYDRKNRILVLGKRTCGKRDEARGLLGLLLALAGK